MRKDIVKFAGKLILLSQMMVMITVAFFVLSAQSEARNFFSLLTESYYPAGEGEVENYISKVQNEKNYTKLILGDSVCNQTLNWRQEINDQYCIVGNNRALTMAGNYLLLDEFLKVHDETTEVYLIVGPDALESEIDPSYSYQYIVMPFLRTRLLQNLDTATLDEMEDTFGSLFMNPRVAKVIEDSSVGRKWYLNYLAQKYEIENIGWVEHNGLSELSATYLKKMYELCIEKGIEFYLLPTPVADNGLRHDQMKMLEEDFAEIGYDVYFQDYFKNVSYYPEDQFSDGTHFGENYDNQEHLYKIAREMYQEKGYMTDLK